MARNFVIVASHVNDSDTLDRIASAHQFKGWTTADNGLVALDNGTLIDCFSSRVSSISWNRVEGELGRRTKVVAELSHEMVARRAADLRSLDQHIDELRKAQASWGKLRQTPGPYEDWLRTFVSGNAVLLHQIAEEDELKNVWALIDSGLSVHDWIGGPFYAATTFIDATTDDSVLYELDPSKPWTWRMTVDQLIEEVPKDAYLSVLEVEE